MAELTDKDLLARLVRFESVSTRSNSEIIEFIRDYFDRVAGANVLIERDVSDDGRSANIIATCGPDLAASADRNGLVLCGHLDVVPANEPEWRSDPFTLTERDGRLIARGAADMKGFDALAINVIARTAQRAESLAYPLVIVLTFDEEVGSIGARHLVENWPDAKRLPRHCVIGEPTSLRAVRMHKGHLSMQITLHGKAAHSGSPHLGENAIEPAAEIVLALRSLRMRFEQMQLDTSRHFSSVPFPVLNVVGIQGGEAVNVIPDSCTIDVGIRLMPGQSRDEAVSMVEAAVRDAANDTPIDVAVVRENPPLLTAEDAPLHRAICELVNQPESVGVSFASDGGWLSTLGMDCVLFGPGAIEVAHKPNEAMPIDEFTRTRELLERLVARFCMNQ